MAMTEDEWRQYKTPELILRSIRTSTSRRKLRLFACNACRVVWHLLTHPFHNAVEVAERFADGLSTREELAAARSLAERAASNCLSGRFRRPNLGQVCVGHAASSVLDATSEDHEPYDIAMNASKGAAWAQSHKEGGLAQLRWAYHQRGAGEAAFEAQAEMLKDMFRNPLYPPLGASPYLSETVLELARLAYRDRPSSGRLDPVHLGILGDALEETGYPNPELLAHLRKPEPHVRGCWALDFILGMS
jgi:hypothetical protein